MISDFIGIHSIFFVSYSLQILHILRTYHVVKHKMYLGDTLMNLLFVWSDCTLNMHIMTSSVISAFFLIQIGIFTDIIFKFMTSETTSKFWEQYISFFVVSITSSLYRIRFLLSYMRIFNAAQPCPICQPFFAFNEASVCRGWGVGGWGWG